MSEAVVPIAFLVVISPIILAGAIGLLALGVMAVKVAWGALAEAIRE